jgi:hypothetical protein
MREDLWHLTHQIQQMASCKLDQWFLDQSQFDDTAHHKRLAALGPH